MSKRTTKGQFPKGQSGNPSGRPPGSRNQATLLAEQLIDDAAEQLTRKIIERANQGDSQALRWCLDRVLPMRRDRTVDLELAPAQNSEELMANLRSILAAVGEGRITPAEGQSLTGILNSQAQMFELAAVEQRLQELEEFSKNFLACKQEMQTDVERIVNEIKKTKPPQAA